MNSVRSIHVNCYVGKISNLNQYFKEFRTIFNQQPYVIKSRKKSASFKLRAGIKCGLKATIRGKNLANFITILRFLILPSIRNFKGFKPSIANGRFINLGIRNIEGSPHLISSNITHIKGFNLTIETTSDHPESLYSELGIPII